MLGTIHIFPHPPCHTTFLPYFRDIWQGLDHVNGAGNICLHGAWEWLQPRLFAYSEWTTPIVSTDEQVLWYQYPNAHSLTDQCIVDWISLWWFKWEPGICPEAWGCIWRWVGRSVLINCMNLHPYIPWIQKLIRITMSCRISYEIGNMYIRIIQSICKLNVAQNSYSYNSKNF